MIPAEELKHMRMQGRGKRCDLTSNDRKFTAPFLTPVFRLQFLSSDLVWCNSVILFIKDGRGDRNGHRQCYNEASRRYESMLLPLVRPSVHSFYSGPCSPWYSNHEDSSVGRERSQRAVLKVT